MLAVVVPAWAVAAFAGAWTARRIGNLFSAAIVGLLTLVALVCNISMLPYPVWFKVANLVVIPIAILVASRPLTLHKHPKFVTSIDSTAN